MIDDGTIKQLCVKFENDSWFNPNEYDYTAYKYKYTPNPTIVSTMVDAFQLNNPSELIEQPGVQYVDRVVIHKDWDYRKVQSVMQTMLNNLQANPRMQKLAFEYISFKMPGWGDKYLRELETPNKLELRLYAKGYPIAPWDNK